MWQAQLSTLKLSILEKWMGGMDEKAKIRTPTLLQNLDEKEKFHPGRSHQQKHNNA